MKSLRLYALIIFVVSIAIFASESPEPHPSKETTELLRRLDPLGYWQLNEGRGRKLYDYSGNGNNAVVYNVLWEAGLLEFTGAYQWLEIPAIDEYQKDDLSFGLWVFNRKPEYRRKGALLFGNCSYLRKFRQFGICLNKDGILEVVGDNKKDPLLEEKQIPLTQNRWHHILYTSCGDKAKLYLDGQLVSELETVFDIKTDFFIGNDADWWMLHPPGSNSLNGSVRNVILMEGQLSQERIDYILRITEPQSNPEIFAENDVMIDGRGVSIEELSSLEIDNRLYALELIDRWSVSKIRSNETHLLPVLTQSVYQWQTARISASILEKLGGANVEKLLQHKVLPYCVELIRDNDSSKQRLFAAAAVISELTQVSKDCVDVLTDTLRDMITEQGTYVPKIEDYYRNAVMYALLKVGSKSPDARKVLGKALAKPVLETLDISKPALAKVRLLAERKRFMDALDIYSELPADEKTEWFFTQGDKRRNQRPKHPNLRAYTPTASFDGFSYQVGSGIPFESADKISSEEFKNLRSKLSKKYPQAKEWRQEDFDSLYKVVIKQTTPEGKENSTTLENGWLVFDGTDAKMRGWSVGVDKEGYIHITGGQHNAPNYDNYIPGVWEKMGLSKERGDDKYPALMYWVSTEPSDISEFRFVGQNANPIKSDLPGYFNYMNFIKDREDELYVYGRTNIAGFQSWGMYRYDTQRRRWFAVGGDACDIITDAENNTSDWRESLINQYRGSVPTEPAAKCVVWAWQPHFYNYCRASRGWGLHFDITNRMHLRVPIRALDKNKRIIDNEVYAYSNDDGKTFYRADGSRVLLPLTTNPAPKHNADINNHHTKHFWQIWLSLLEYAGYKDI